MRRSHVLLAGAVAVAAGAAFWPDSDRPRTPAASISATAPAVEVAAFANRAETTPTTTGVLPPVAAPATPAAAPATPAMAPASATIDLDKIALDGDHYVAPLDDGRKAVLTLDRDLQAYAEKLLDESRAPRGAIVAMAPDGRILALAGRHTKDPRGSRTGTFDWRLATEVWAPAASIFKLVTASALVKVGVKPDGRVCYHGGVRSVMEHNLRDHRSDSRCESLAYGVAHSQNAIVGKLAFQNLEPQLLEAEARSFGWSEALAGLKGATGELSLPTSRDLEFAKAAAGFHGARLSVVGGALIAATFARAGEQPAPQLVASIDGVATTPTKPRRAITADAARAVARMMVGTCETGSAARTFGKRRKIQVAGKTGTLTHAKPFYLEHSWFVGFAPVGKPEIIVSVLLGNPESWQLRGHEAARRLIDRALKPATTREKDRVRSVTVDKRNQW